MTLILGSRTKPDPALPKMPTKTRTIVSIFPREAFNKNYSFGAFRIDACPKCEVHQRTPCQSCGTYAELVVGARRESIDSPEEADGSGRRLAVIDADSITEALLTEGCLDRGVFVAEGDEPTKAELEAAHAAYTSWGEGRIAHADDTYARTGKNSDIDPHAHDFARYQGLTRDWLQDTSAKVDCVGCGERVKPGSIMCKCGFPINWEKARMLGRVNPEMEAFAISEGLLQPRETVQTPVAEAEEARVTVGTARRGSARKLEAEEF